MTDHESPSSAPAAGRGSGGGPWSARALIAFAAILVALAAIGLASRLHRAPAPRGLPDDPGVRAARTALGGHLEVAGGELRFATSLDDPDAEEGLAAPSTGLVADQAQRIAQASRGIEEARERLPRDERLWCALGHLDLAAQRLERAERRYRQALGKASRYGEARLGLGVALALQATTEGDEKVSRRLTLQAIAQFAAVEESDPFYLPALYNRVTLLARVGRIDEAKRWALHYAEADPGSPWSISLARRVGTPAR